MSVSSAGPSDPHLRRDWLRERRAIIREHHPDRGGSPDELVNRLARLDRLVADQERGTPRPGSITMEPPSRWQPIQRIVWRASRRAHRRIRSIRSAIPQGWPGSRRYIDL